MTLERAPGPDQPIEARARWLCSALGRRIDELQRAGRTAEADEHTRILTDARRLRDRVCKNER